MPKHVFKKLHCERKISVDIILYFYRKLECYQCVTLAKPGSCCLFNPALVVICYKINTGCTLLHFCCLCRILWDSKTYREKQFWKTSFTVVPARLVSKIYYGFPLPVVGPLHGKRTHHNSTFCQLLLDIVAFYLAVFAHLLIYKCFCIGRQL